MRVIPWIIFVLLISLATWSWSSHGIVFDMLRADLEAAQRIERLKAFFETHDQWAPLTYVGFVTAEVILAPIPGLMLYAPGGLIFGPVLGGTLALLGNVLGAGISCGLTRSLGSAWLDRFLSRDAIERLQQSKPQQGSCLIFLLRLNPLTSSDLVSYAAGFTRIPIWQVMVATGLGMAPLCYAQAWLSDSLFTAFPSLIYPMLVLCGVYVVLVSVIVGRMVRGKER